MESCFQFELQAQGIRGTRCAVMAQLRQPGHFERIPVQVPLSEFSYKQSTCILEWLELDDLTGAADLCRAKALNDEGNVVQVLSFTESNKKKLEFPLIVRILNMQDLDQHIPRMGSHQNRTLKMSRLTGARLQDSAML